MAPKRKPKPNLPRVPIPKPTRPHKDKRREHERAAVWGRLAEEWLKFRMSDHD
jgi:hypothetical protein